MRVILLLCALTCLCVPVVALEGEKDEAPGVREDRARIRESLRKMDRVTPAKRQERLSLVVQEGISGLDPKAKPPRPGEMAPDFELTPLRVYGFRTRQSGEARGDAGALYQPVRLSDFRGKRPVVLIFGSYT